MHARGMGEGRIYLCEIFGVELQGFEVKWIQCEIGYVARILGRFGDRERGGEVVDGEIHGRE